MLDIQYVFDGNIFVKDASLTETFIYYDGPLLFTIKRDENKYLVTWATCDENFNYWLVCPFNSNYTEGQSLLPIFEEARLNGDLGYISVNNDCEINSLTFKGDLKDFVG